MASAAQAAEIAAIVAGVKQIFATTFRGHYYLWHISSAGILVLPKLSCRPSRAENYGRCIVVSVQSPVPWTYAYLNFKYSRHFEHGLRRSFPVHFLCPQFRKESPYQHLCNSLEFFGGEAPCDFDHLRGPMFLRQRYLESHNQQIRCIFHRKYFFTVFPVYELSRQIFLAVTCLALGLVTTVEIFTIELVIGTRKFSIISGLVQGLAALNDVVITTSLCYYLHHSRSGLPSTDKFVDALILYAVSRGVLTAITQILFLVTNVALPGATYWQPFHQAVGKLYVNSVLATLNVRSTFKEKSEVQLGTGPNFKFDHEGTPTDGISMDSSGHRKPIIFAATKGTLQTTDNSGIGSSNGGGGSEKFEEIHP
ncbi:hypothetical protein B0H10DRAFT_31047 [Mycena sp. CBHHK59/15]|nr:hypothetical protein B0H10DRAFT_31047 [Mycena sp. CBHHK59/15]